MEQTNVPAEWKELISQLPAILSSEFVMDANGTVTELHVLSDTSRAAKQIVRDIQSAMMARFGLELDHRIISVAQIPQEPSPACVENERIVCLGLDLSIRNSDCEVTVKLSCNGKNLTGRAAAGASPIERRRAAAVATAEAVNQYADKLCRLRVDDVRSIELAGNRSIIVAVCFSCCGRDEMLVGSCFCKEEESLSAVRATLDAINRKLSILC